MAKAGYVVVGYTPAQSAKWREGTVQRRPGEKRSKPKPISGVIETQAGANAYADLVRKQGGEVTDIQATITPKAKSRSGNLSG